MPVKRSKVQIERFNRESMLPFELRINDIQMAMQDVYDFFYDVNSNLSVKGLKRLDDMLRPAAMSGLLSDILNPNRKNK